MLKKFIKRRLNYLREREAKAEQQLKQTLSQSLVCLILFGLGISSAPQDKVEAYILPSELTTEIKLTEIPSQNMGIPVLSKPAPARIFKSPYVKKINLKSKYSPYIYKSATKHGVDPLLLEALIKHESGFNPNAVSKCGAIGLCQLMPSTAKNLGIDPYDPIQNIEGGAMYLSQQLKTFKSKKLALAAYNAGPGRVTQYKGIPPYKETINYVASITADYKRNGGIV